MPIKKLIQENLSFREGLPQLGWMRKGAPKKDDRPGEDLDYFRIILKPRYLFLQPLLDDLWGEKPAVFENVHVMERTAEAAFGFWMEEWGGSRNGQPGSLYRRCDGEHQVQHYDGKAYSFSRINCEPHLCACQRIGRLSLAMGDILEATGIWGYFTVYTSSINDIIRVQQCLQSIEAIAAEAGKSLVAPRLIFGRYDTLKSTPAFKKAGSGYVQTDKRVMKQYSLFDIEIHPDWMKAKYLPALEDTPLLPETIRPYGETRLADASKKALLGSGSGPRRIVTAADPDGNGSQPKTNGINHKSDAVDMETEVPPPDFITQAESDDDIINAQFEEVPPDFITQGEVVTPIGILSMIKSDKRVQKAWDTPNQANEVIHGLWAAGKITAAMTDLQRAQIVLDALTAKAKSDATV